MGNATDESIEREHESKLRGFIRSSETTKRLSKRNSEKNRSVKTLTVLVPFLLVSGLIVVYFLNSNDEINLQNNEQLSTALSEGASNDSEQLIRELNKTRHEMQRMTDALNASRIELQDRQNLLETIDIEIGAKKQILQNLDQELAELEQISKTIVLGQTTTSDSYMPDQALTEAQDMVDAEPVIDARLEKPDENQNKLIETASFSQFEEVQSDDFGIHTIRNIQRRLAHLYYYSGTIDGILDQRTIDAIAAFQRDAGVDMTGSPSIELLIQLNEINTR